MKEADAATLATVIEKAETVSPAALVAELTPEIAPADPQLPTPATPDAPHVARMVSADELISVEMPAKGKGNRSLDDYAKLDWSKGNTELAKIAGVTRQRIAQIRQDLKEREEKEALSGSTSEIGGMPQSEQKPFEATPAQAATIAAPAAPAVNYQLMAETVFAMSTGLATMLIGPEWQPRQLKTPTGETVEEKTAVVEALRSYFESKQFQDLPPGYMLCFVVASYAAPRFAHENTRSKAKLTWLWFKTKVGGWFSRRKQFVPRIVNHATPATEAKKETN